MTVTLKGSGSTDWARPAGCPDGFEPRQVLVGKSDGGGMALEVAITRWTKHEPPTREQLTRLHTIRLNKRATPVVVVVELDSGGTLVFGPNAGSAPLGPLPEDQTQRVVQAVLDEPTVLAARARLAGLVQAIDSTAISGVKNSGLFANHELRVGVPQRADWSKACGASTPLLSERGPQLIQKLGFQVARAGAHALLLTGVGPRPEAIAVMLDERESFDANSPRFTISPVAYGLMIAVREGVPWLIMLRGTQLRLYPARIEVGVGRKGLAETFFEVDLPHLTRDNAGYLSLIFAAPALADGGTTHEILRSSAQFAVALGARLRDKVYEDIVPELSVAVADALIAQGYEMDAKGLDLAYQLTLRVFFRMLFQVYAEDRKLLPYGENTKYDRNAIKTVAKDLAADPSQEFDAESTALWDDLAQVWRVIDSGDKAWGIPPYNGGLFASDPELNEHGAILTDIRITNDVMGPVLKALLLDDDGEGGVGPVDFRPLGVREFGTIYEGLLESSLGLAEVDLTLDDDNNWIPAKKKSDKIWAPAGTVYFHNTSGQRKGTGSYFTPSFVVEHLLERALDPALDAHLAQVAIFIGKGDQAGAAEKFFDFRVADLAMGSGHFLTASIDHIEQKMAAFLAEDGHFIPGVAAELQRLEQAAREQLGPDAPEPERSSLLRRQIARRCIYGLDINPIAVELARVSIWIHTFVRGLPMSSLDHNLVCANSLTGIGSVEEALDVLVPGRKGQMTFFDAPIEDALNRARTVLVDAALLDEATKDETKAASRAAKKARKEAEQARLLFDAAVLTRIGRGGLVSAPGDVDAIAKLAAQDHVQEVLRPLNPGHMPVLFPEVFLRANSGFDVVVGNPPWDMVHVEADVWWGKYMPGIRGLAVKEMNSAIDQLRSKRPDLEELFQIERRQFDDTRAVLMSGPYPGIGSGHVDLYQVFAWRNWQMIRSGGSTGLVLPRVALLGSGSAEWRRAVLKLGRFADVAVAVNNKQWVFGAVDGRYSLAFVVINRDSELKGVRLSGPFFSLEEFLKGKDISIELSIETILGGSDSAAFPMLFNPQDGSVYATMRRHPSLAAADGLNFRPIQGDLNGSADRGQFRPGTEIRDGEIPVLAGASFSHWNPDSGDIYGAASVAGFNKWSLVKLQKASNNKRSAHYGLSYCATNDLPFRRARIVYRRITNPTNTRTVLPCLIPPESLITEAASYLLFSKGEELSEAYLLGVLSSRSFDWYIRKWVELNLTFELFMPAPVPAVESDDQRIERVVEIAGRLAAVDIRYESWAKAIGVETGSVKTKGEKYLLIAELDALVAHLYRLNRKQVIHIFSTFHRGWDYMQELEKVLEFYDKLPKVKP